MPSSKVHTDAEKLAALQWKKENDATTHETAKKFGVSAPTINLWKKNYRLIKKNAEELHRSQYKLEDINRNKLLNHEGNMIDKISAIESELWDKLQKDIKGMKTETALKLMDKIISRIEVLKSIPKAETGSNIQNNITQNNFFDTFAEEAEKEGYIKL